MKVKYGLFWLSNDFDEPAVQFNVCEELGHNPGVDGHLYKSEAAAIMALELYFSVIQKASVSKTASLTSAHLSDSPGLNAYLVKLISEYGFAHFRKWIEARVKVYPVVIEREPISEELFEAQRDYGFGVNIFSGEEEKLYQEIAALRNVVQVGLISTREAMLDCWNKHFPDKPLSLKKGKLEAST